MAFNSANTFGTYFLFRETLLNSFIKKYALKWCLKLLFLLLLTEFLGIFNFFLIYSINVLRFFSLPLQWSFLIGWALGSCGSATAFWNKSCFYLGHRVVSLAKPGNRRFTCCPVLTYIQGACFSKHCVFFCGFDTDSGITALHTVHIFLYLKICILLLFWKFVIFT